MTYVYLITYSYKSCYKNGEGVNTTFYYADRKISGRSLEDAKEAVQDISLLAERGARKKLGLSKETISVVIKDIKFVE